MATSHILTAIEPLTSTIGSGGSSSSAMQQQSHQQHSRSPDLSRNLTATLDDRELWIRFQNLTNEMIVTKNGRFVFLVVS